MPADGLAPLGDKTSVSTVTDQVSVSHMESLASDTTERPFTTTVDISHRVPSAISEKVLVLVMSPRNIDDEMML